MKELKPLLILLLPAWPRFLAAVLMGFFTVAANIGLMAASAVLISRAALRPPVLDLMMLIVAVRFFGISRGVFRYLERYLAHDLTFRLLSRIRTHFFAALEPLAPAGLAGFHSGDLLSRIAADVDTLKDFYLRVLAPLCAAGLVLASAGVFLCYFVPAAALVLLLFSLLAGVAAPLLIGRLGRGLKTGQLRLRGQLQASLVDSIQGMGDVLAFGQAAERSRQASALDDQMARGRRRLAILDGLGSGIGQLAMQLAMWTVLLLAIPLVSSGQLPGIYLAMLPLAVSAGFEAVLQLPMVFPQLEESRAAAGRLWQIIQGKPQVLEPARPAALPADFHLRVTGLSFRYGPDQPPVFQDLSFQLPPGSRLAISGPSGAGKSTLIRILLRFWEYPAGSIRLGGREIRDYDPEALRSLYAVVSQDTHLFNTTVRENLLLAKPEAGDGEIEQAARLARIHDFILSLPRGYETVIGEGGFKLSGGQRQRLAIARAFLRDAPILLLDEPTASLDQAAEREVLDALEGLMSGRSTLLISHRELAVSRMDQVLEMRLPA